MSQIPIQRQLQMKLQSAIPLMCKIIDQPIVNQSPFKFGCILNSTNFKNLHQHQITQQKLDRSVSGSSHVQFSSSFVVFSTYSSVTKLEK